MFWIALPLAVVLALWMGPGLDPNDEMALPAPVTAPPTVPEPPVDASSECDEPTDPGPDGDR